MESELKIKVNLSYDENEISEFKEMIRKIIKEVIDEELNKAIRYVPVYPTYAKPTYAPPPTIGDNPAMTL
jgi:hypothetical protein